MNLRWASKFPKTNCSDVRWRTTPTLGKLHVFNPRQFYNPLLLEGFCTYVLKELCGTCICPVGYSAKFLVGMSTQTLEHAPYSISDQHLWLTLSIPYFRVEQKLIPHFRLLKLEHNSNVWPQLTRNGFHCICINIWEGLQLYQCWCEKKKKILVNKIPNGKLERKTNRFLDQNHSKTLGGHTYCTVPM